MLRALRCGGFVLACALATVTRADTESRLLIQESPLAGFQYHAGREVWDELRVGDALSLTREPDNPYDAQAVRVDWRGLKLGYVPRRENVDVARFLDRGLALTARISRLAESRDPWQRVRFDVFLPLENPAPAAKAPDPPPPRPSP